jgi:hypothetical protein
MVLWGYSLIIKFFGYVLFNPDGFGEVAVWRAGV